MTIESFIQSLDPLAVPDPRVSTWPLMASPWPTLIIISLFLVIVWNGPRIMVQKSKPFDLKPVLIVYNFFAVAMSAYIFWEFFASSVLNPNFPNLLCSPIDRSENPASIRLARACWLYFISKFFELLDTCFFILRKKYNQISFLHVYHHASMPLIWRLSTRMVPGGTSYFSAMGNCWIHILMYTYYALSACGPSFQKFLWWKRYMTTLQLTQFFSVLAHTLGMLYFQCGYPNFFSCLLLVYICSQILLFSHFYHKTYIKKEQRRSTSTRNHVLRDSVDDEWSQRNGSLVKDE